MLIPAADAKLQVLRLARGSAVTVTADRDRLRQVLVNLIGNAVKFTPADGNISVAVTLPRVDGESWGEIRVTDNGPGIPPAEREAVFDPYYRSEHTTALPGVGLGLAISRALVEQMGGDLTLESEMGRGTSFIVRLRSER